MHYLIALHTTRCSFDLLLLLWFCFNVASEILFVFALSLSLAVDELICTVGFLRIEYYQYSIHYYMRVLIHNVGWEDRIKIDHQLYCTIDLFDCLRFYSVLILWRVSICLVFTLTAWWMGPNN